jgi:anti-anti-sigma regulatory factor
LRATWRAVSFAVIVRFAADPPTLRCSGDEDRSTQARRRQALARALKARADVVVDLAGLSWADASLMIDFAMLARRLRAHDLVLTLRDPQPQIAALVELVGLRKLPGVRIERTAAPVAALA